MEEAVVTGGDEVASVREGSVVVGVAVVIEVGVAALDEVVAVEVASHGVAHSEGPALDSTLCIPRLLQAADCLNTQPLYSQQLS